MAISREKKNAIVSDIAKLVDSSRLTVFAKIDGLSVKAAENLRRQAAADKTVIRVVKNRLVKIALKNDSRFAETDLSALNGQLLYAFNADDEVGSARSLAQFAKTHGSLTLSGGFDDNGRLLGEQAVASLAQLPDKPTLRAQLAGTLQAPISGLARVLVGNTRGLLQVLRARQEQLT